MPNVTLEELADIRKRIDAGTKQANKDALMRFKQKPLPVCRIGIDPAARKAGFCVCVIDEEGTARFTTFGDVLDFVYWLDSDGPENAIVTVENSNLQNVTFDMGGSKSVVARKSRNVGKNQEASRLTVKACIRKYGKGNVNNISPKQKGRKLNERETMSIATMKRHKFARYDGSQDARDAYKLAIYGL